MINGVQKVHIKGQLELKISYDTVLIGNDREQVRKVLSVYLFGR